MRPKRFLTMMASVLQYGHHGCCTEFCPGHQSPQRSPQQTKEPAATASTKHELVDLNIGNEGTSSTARNRGCLRRQDHCGPTVQVQV